MATYHARFSTQCTPCFDGAETKIFKTYQTVPMEMRADQSHHADDKAATIDQWCLLLFFKGQLLDDLRFTDGSGNTMSLIISLFGSSLTGCGTYPKVLGRPSSAAGAENDTCRFGFVQGFTPSGNMNEENDLIKDLCKHFYILIYKSVIINSIPVCWQSQSPSFDIYHDDINCI